MLCMAVQETRMQSYPNYVNLRDVFEQNHDRLRKDSLSVIKVTP